MYTGFPSSVAVGFEELFARDDTTDPELTVGRQLHASRVRVVGPEHPVHLVQIDLVP